jgi:hypothetical protein
LISGRYCGKLTGEIISYGMFFEPTVLYLSQESAEYLTYATECYGEAWHPQSEVCGTFTQPRLPYTSDRNASCPFALELCKSATGNLLLDSGELDSSHYLGLNIGPPLTVRQRTHCAPLKTYGYTEVFKVENSSQRFLRYKYWTGDDEYFIYQIGLDKKLRLSAFSNGDYKTS